MDKSNLDLGWCQGYMGLQYHMEEATIEQNVEEAIIEQNVEEAIIEQNVEEAIIEQNVEDITATFSPPFAIFSKKYYNEICELNHDKIYDFCFIGSISSNYQSRKWVINFAKKYFTVNSIFINTDNPPVLLGSFDYSNKNLGYCPKKMPDNQSKNTQYRVVADNIEYFEKMCKSKYCLCPAGDSSWSFRFYEVLMCKSIPVVESWHHTYRTKEEANINYKYILYQNIENYALYQNIENIENDINLDDYVNENTKIFENYHLLK